jgi:GntR family transcriptional regulator/MocR family aminotransferase
VHGSGTYVLEPPAPIEGGAEGIKEGPPVNESDNDSWQNISLSSWAKRLMMCDKLASSAPDVSAEVNYNAPLLELLPINLWKKALYKSSSLEDLSVLSYTADPLGFRPLREALAEYLARARQINCSPDQIAIFGHTEAGTDKLARLLLQPNDLVGVEEPGSPGVRITFFTHQARFMPLPVDQEGIVVDKLVASKETPRLIYLTPSHQDPTGVAMSMARREMLLEWAKDKDCFIIEDDYDSEYYYGQRILPALMSMDKNQRVIYRFNFWTSLFPLVRIGFLVLPKRLVPVVTRARMLTERDVSFLEQKALATFISLGYFERHLSRTRTLYESRRAAVLHAIARFCKTYIQVSPITSGTNLLAHFSPHLTEEHIIACAKSSGVPIVSTSEHYAGVPKRNEFLIAFNTLTEEAVDDIFRQFADLLKQTGSTGRAPHV